MKYVERITQSDTKEITLFGRTGEELSKDSAHNKRSHFAKVVKNNSVKAGSVTYYVKIYQSTPFDPMGPYGRRERNLDTEMRRVSKNTFDFYMTYLKTNNSIYLTKAQRGFLND
tara:strand:+ start:234 stop:575 length:342 start_codon:yes stop_codon:yes gene_type:complete